MLNVGGVGTVVTALCCSTPLLALLFGAVGLSALLGWLEVVLVPALLGFFAITPDALWRQRGAA